jgi:Domain of unknown function (DUF1996)
MVREYLLRREMPKVTLMLAITIMATVLLAAVAWAQDGSNFGTTCDVSHHSDQDPIFEPLDGQGHDHIYFGATSPDVANDDTGYTLRDLHLKPDQTTCNWKVNFSAYWLPEVYRNGSTTPLPVDTDSKILGDNTIYYRAGDVRNSGIITVFPSDFEIVARDDGGPGDVRWSCDRTGRPLTEAPPATCSTRLLKVNIQFPQCWDKVQVDDSENKPEFLRMANGDGNCTFDGVKWRAVPQITMSLNFVLPTTEVGTITVAGDDADGQLPYRSMHADFMNGWDQAVLTDLVTNCIKNVPQGTPQGGKPDRCKDPERPR